MRSFLASLALAFVLFGSARASAQDERVSVLGITSAEGDLEFVRNLTGALRHAASQIPGWDVSNQEVAYEQMSIAHGCSQPDAACLSQIASTLNADRVIYGDVRRSTSGPNYNFVVSLHIFTAANGEITRSLSDTVPRVRSDIDQLRDRVRRYVTELGGVGQSGRLRVASNVPSAEVLVDGQSRGATSEGVLTVEVPAGRHRIEVIADAHERFRGTVTVVAGDTAELEVELSRSGGASTGELNNGAQGGRESNISIPGLVLIGAAAVAAGLTLYSWARINAIDTNSTFTEYRRMVPRNKDVCAEAQGTDMMSGNPYGLTAAHVRDVRDLCHEADLLEVLQYVFLGTGIAAGAIGTYLLVEALGEDTDEGAPTVALQPSLGTSYGYVEATVRF